MGKTFSESCNLIPCDNRYINGTVVWPIAVSGIINQSKGDSAYGEKKRRDTIICCSVVCVHVDDLILLYGL